MFRRDFSRKHLGYRSKESIHDEAGSGNDFVVTIPETFSGHIKSIEVKGVVVISYNHLNLPETIEKGLQQSLRYIYDASGRKISQEVYDSQGLITKKSDYEGEFFYENDTLQFINHDEGRVVMTGPEPEYQYNLKDHLGNVRLTFTTKPDVDAGLATLETVDDSEGRSEFLNYDEAIKVNYDLFDHTYNDTTGATYYSTRLTGANTNAVYGLAKSLSVMPGDTIKMKVFAKYLDPDPDNWTEALTNFMAAIAGGGAPAGTVVDGGSAGSIGSGSFPFAGMFDHSSETETAPKAYLNYIVFDRDFNPLIAESGYRRITTASKENGNNVPHDKLEKESLVIKQPGYVYIYLSNENETPVEVYFDDFKVEHIKSPLVQMDEYYPFGLTFNSFQRENSLDQNYKFNGKEEQTELGLGWLDFGRRMHQPEIGRFFTQDRFAEKYYALNPYQYGANNPIIFNDINGDSLWINFGNNRVLYNNGQLENADGSRYEGEGVKVTKKGNIRITNSFLRSTVGALKTIGSAEAGANLVGELQSSDNNFTIKQGNYRFDPDNKNNASFHQVMDEGKLVDPSKGVTQIGSGGTIYFNPEVSPTINGTTFSPAIGLAHEMFHGSDSNSGELDSRNIPFNGVCCEQRQEIRATYFQNVLSQQLGGGYPLRKYYGGTKYPPMPPALLNGSTPMNTYPPSFYLKIKN